MNNDSNNENNNSNIFFSKPINGCVPTQNVNNQNVQSNNVSENNDEQLLKAYIGKNYDKISKKKLTFQPYSLDHSICVTEKCLCLVYYYS